LSTPPPPPAPHPLSLHDALPICWARRAFTEADLDAIAAAVREAERGTSAEIRVHIERRVAHGLRRRTSDAMQRARDVFAALGMQDRKSTRLNSSHVSISYAVFCL